MYLSLLCDGSFDSLCCDDQVAKKALSQELHFLQGTLQLDPASRRKLTRLQAVTKTVCGVGVGGLGGGIYADFVEAQHY